MTASCALYFEPGNPLNSRTLVAGVYSHGTLTERVLGGATWEMLKSTDMSWFMAH